MAYKTPSWLDYLASYHKKETPSQLSMKEMDNTTSGINRLFSPYFYNCIPVMYLIDYTTGKYLMTSKLSKTVLGHEPDSFTSGGIGFTIENYHKEDLELFNNQMFPDRLKLLKTIPSKEHANYLFSYNFRLKNKKGNYVSLLQRNCFIKSDEAGNPLLSLGMAINIEHYKSDKPIIQTVEKLNDDGLEVPLTFHKKAYYLNDEDKLFSVREKEILLWTAEGLTSKEIAKRLFISEFTVINHRRNMQDKSNTPNTAALIYFAVKQGII